MSGMPSVRRVVDISQAIQLPEKAVLSAANLGTSACEATRRRSWVPDSQAEVVEQSSIWRPLHRVILEQPMRRLFAREPNQVPPTERGGGSSPPQGGGLRGRPFRGR